MLPLSFHCSACRHHGKVTAVASLGDLLEHSGTFHADLYPGLAIAPLVIRRDIGKWIPKISGPTTHPSWLRQRHG